MGRFLRFYAIAGVCLVALGIIRPDAAFACTNPNGVPGEVVYNSASNAFQGCTNTGWAAFHKLNPTPPTPCATPAGTPGEIVYNSNGTVFQGCTTGGWMAFHKLNPTPPAPCANPAGTPGEVVYNSSNTVFQGCTTGGWMAFHAPVSAAPPPILVPAGLIGFWPFDDPPGSATAQDLSGNNNHGTLINMDPNTDWVAGHVGGALDFDGANDRVNLGSAAIFDNMTTMTVCMWVNRAPDGQQSTTYPFLMGKTSNANGDDGWQYYLTNAGTMTYTSPLGDGKYSEWVNPSAWQHLCTTWNGGGAPATAIQHYYNGVQGGNSGTWTGGTLNDAAFNLTIGDINAGGAVGAYPIRARIDDVRLYNRVLTLSEIQELAGQ